MTIREIKEQGFTRHHTSYYRGYESRKVLDDDDNRTAFPYKGRFGTGYRTFHPCFKSSQFCYVTYWVK